MAKNLTITVTQILPDDEYEAAALVLASKAVFDAVKATVDEMLPTATVSKERKVDRVLKPRAKRNAPAATAAEAAETVSETAGETNPDTAEESEVIVEEEAQVLVEATAEEQHEHNHTRRRR